MYKLAFVCRGDGEKLFVSDPVVAEAVSYLRLYAVELIGVLLSEICSDTQHTTPFHPLQHNKKPEEKRSEAREKEFSSGDLFPVLFHLYFPSARLLSLCKLASIHTSKISKSDFSCRQNTTTTLSISKTVRIALALAFHHSFVRLL